jgi:hypothetical protein
MSEKCCAEISGGDMWHRPSCTRASKVERGGKFYCAIHDPVRVKEKHEQRATAWDAKWTAERAERERGIAEAALKDRALAAIRLIADGHNDPRSLAVEVLSPTPTGEPA